MNDTKNNGKQGSLDDPAVVEEICARLIAGEAMSSIGKDPNMPAERTIYYKMANNEEFCSIIARAREAQQDCEIDRTVDMADRATPEDFQVVKLRIWARQWRAGKLAPKKYGDFHRSEVTGKDGAPLVEPPKPDETARAILAMLGHLDKDDESHSS